MPATTKLFVVSVSYRAPKKRPGYDCVDWKTKAVGNFVVRERDHESAALRVAKWLFECKCVSVLKYPRTVKIEVTQHDDIASRGIAWPTNGDGATAYEIENERREIAVQERSL